MLIDGYPARVSRTLAHPMRTLLMLEWKSTLWLQVMSHEDKRCDRNKVTAAEVQEDASLDIIPVNWEIMS